MIWVPAVVFPDWSDIICSLRSMAVRPSAKQLSSSWAKSSVLIVCKASTLNLTQQLLLIFAKLAQTTPFKIHQDYSLVFTAMTGVVKHITVAAIPA